MSLRVFVTGGASGLGRAIAERYAKDGARVLIGDVHEKRMEETVAAIGPNARSIRCDVTKEEDLMAAARWCEETWGGVDIVVNNAGVAASGPIEATSMADWEWIVNINLLGVVRGCKAFVPMLKRQKGGHIVNVASMAGLINPPGAAAYNATKAAVVSISETLRVELAGDNIQIHVLCPAFVRTNLLENFRGANEDSERVTRRLVSRAKMGPAEVAQMVHRGVARGDFHILTHSEGKQAWLFKRFAPGALFVRVARKKAARAMERRGDGTDPRP